jgi:hypothetical protein
MVSPVEPLMVSLSNHERFLLLLPIAYCLFLFALPVA